MTPADFRALIARRQDRVYVLAAKVGVNPGRLGMMLREKIPMTPEISKRLRSALMEQEAKTA